jgi:hypothetical protein
MRTRPLTTPKATLAGTAADSRGGSFRGHVRGGQLLVVGLAVAQAAVQDPDQPVRRGTVWPQG